MSSRRSPAVKLKGKDSAPSSSSSSLVMPPPSSSSSLSLSPQLVTRKIVGGGVDNHHYNHRHCCNHHNNNANYSSSNAVSSPSRNGILLKPKRSCLDYSRLFLIRHRGARCWLWVFVVIVSTYTIINRLQQPKHPLQMEKQEQEQRQQQALKHMRKDSKYKYRADRKLFNPPLETRPIPLAQKNSNKNNNKDATLVVSWLQQQQALSGPAVLQRAQYSPKPLVMGFLLVPTQNGVQNYNVNHRHTYQLENILKKSKKSATTKQWLPETFQIVRIHPQDYNIVQDVTNTTLQQDLVQKEQQQGNNHHLLLKSHDQNDHDHAQNSNNNIQWTFEKVKVSALGNGEQRQDEIRTESKDYARYKPDNPPEGCEPQYDWQIQSFPNCNDIHAVDLLTRARTLNPAAKKPQGVLLARGGYRDVWYMEHNHNVPAAAAADDKSRKAAEVVAMKTLLYEHPWTERNMDRHRRDALATDRLTGSPYALNIFGYCANTGIYEFADGGSLEDAVDNESEYAKWNATTKMNYAYQVARAIADVHNIDQEGLPSMSHTDISMSQFVSTNGGETFVINDFNRARFLYRRKDDHTTLCKFEVGSNKGKFRAPEEYSYEPETEKIDVYSEGNILYVLLTGKYPFEDDGKEEAKLRVMVGKRPKIDEEYLNSKDPLIQALVTATQRCWTQKPEKRPTSREIEQFLRPFATGTYMQQQQQQPNNS